ncbi:MAG: hypothetical protein NC299_10390 [Lachnospiraceae bacterium]|nr:hypothetical protein [Lachnospiraceae bacterium]
MRGGVGNGVRVNIKDFVENAESVFKADGEYTWRAELVQEVDPANGLFPDNMVYEGSLVGEPTVRAIVANIQGHDYSNYLPLTPDIHNRIKPPYYVDFLDSKYNGGAYDIPITYAEQRTDNNSGEQFTAIRLTTFASTVKDTDALLRPAIGTSVLVHKKKNYGTPATIMSSNPNTFFIDADIAALNDGDNSNDGVYLKISDSYYKVLSYNKATGAITCQNGDEVYHKYPAGTHYSIYTTHFSTPHYYFRVHNMPKLTLSAEFHEHRRMQQDYYDDTINCLDNTFNGVLFKAELIGDSHAAVKYFYWEIFNEKTGKLLLKTERIYSQEMECEFFVPFGNTYTGRITVITQDGITLSDEVSYTLPSSPIENDKKFKLRAIQNRFGGIELAWDYSYWYDGGSLWKANQFEVWRLEKRINKLKYLGKVDCSPIGISGVTPAASGGNWYLIDKSCDFSLKTPVGAKVNMYLVGGGSDGGSYKVTPNSSNQSFATPTNGGQGGCFIKKSLTSSDGQLKFRAKVAQRNDNTDTTLSVNGNTYKCNDSGYSQRGSVKGNTMTQSSGKSVVYNDNAQNGANGFETPYGYVASSGGGGAACGDNRTVVDGADKEINVIGLTVKSEHKKDNWILIDREDLGGKSGDFTLDVPEGSRVRMFLVGGGSDGATWGNNPIPGWDNSHSDGYAGGGGGYILEKEIDVNGRTVVHANIADRNETIGTSVTIGGSSYNCNDNGSTKTADTRNATAIKYRNGSSAYKDAENGVNGTKTPFGYVGSSGSGGDAYNSYRHMYKGKPGEGAGMGGSVNVGTKTVTNGTDAIGYGCGGGGAAAATFDYRFDLPSVDSQPGKGAPGCIIFKIESYEVSCPDPGIGGIGAGNGGDPGENGTNAFRYGCGGGGAGYWAVVSDGNYTIADNGKGMQGCIILEIDLSGLEGGSGEQVYCVDWTAASDKDYQYIVTGCNYETEYKARHNPLDMIECTATVDVKPHFTEFFIYFLNDADVLCDTKLNYENYETPLVEPMGRYVTSKNNNYRMIRRHNHTLALERDDKSFYRRHTWRIEGDVELGEVTHNITRNINAMYARMPSVTDEGTDYDSFPMSFLFGYLDCEEAENSGFVYDDQYMFELWKKCVFEKKTVMIKDPKGNVWTGVLDAHGYEVEYDTDGMPYIINVQFTQTRTEHNTRVMIVDDHNEYLKTVKGNHLK